MLKFLVILLFIYLALKLSVRFLLPWMIRRFVRRAERKFYQANPNAQRAKEREDGDISIVNGNKEKYTGNPSGKVGEYVEFEEIKED